MTPPNPVPSGSVLGCGIIGEVVAMVIIAKRSQSITRLVTERDTLKISAQRVQFLEEDFQQKYGELCALHLSGLMQRMGLRPNDRISIYKHTGAAFIRIARHSAHPDFARPGRSVYPDAEGCMGHAFREGEAFEESLPANKASYERKLIEKWGMEQESIATLKMKSRSIAAFALQRNALGRRFAIIVFESMSAGSIDSACRNKFSAEERANLIQWLETMERFEPKPTEAQKEGF